SRINIQKVNAQQARRILDRIVGYTLSPILWKRHYPGLSAGRVQSVALRIICDREKDIRAFKPEEYWTITSLLAGSVPPEFYARLSKIKGKIAKINNGEDATRIVNESRQHPFIVDNVIKREKQKRALPPFITSTLQQEAFRRFRYSSKKTMSIAQQLYEGIEVGNEGSVGLITYHRTDSTRISNEALQTVRQFIQSKFGADYLPSKPNFFKNKKGIQDAHEAIRPSRIDLTPESIKNSLSDDAWKLYQIIWQRFVASQMLPAIFDETIIQIKNGDCIFEATGEVLKFPSFLVIYQELEEEKEEKNEDTTETPEKIKISKLPLVAKNDILELKNIIPKQNFTKPLPRYSEALLIKELERLGIGRPSTYVSIISKIKDRHYTETFKGRFIPTELGIQVTDFLTEQFPDVLDIKFTAAMEDNLDGIEEGNSEWIQILHNFYETFKIDLDKTKEYVKNNKVTSVPTEFSCSNCGKQMVLKWGKNGQFLACSGYPQCQTTMDFKRDENGKIIPNSIEIEEDTCDKCGAKMVVKRGKFGPFLACSAYPECKNTRNINVSSKPQPAETEMKCEKCGSDMILRTSNRGQFWGCSKYPKCKNIKPFSMGIPCPIPDCSGKIVMRTARGRVFYGCSEYPGCTFTTAHKPIAKKCPLCNYPLLVEKADKDGNIKIVCLQKKCDYEEKFEN
ncbi:MAG: DNA topoisomerase I, partial [Candidatus Schekmanbacteria bacterium RBG_13_48_7]